MKKIGTVILAAGMGRRLGLGVKALVPVGGKPLIDHLLQKSGEDVIVYTSRATHDPIQAYVKDRALFLQEMGGEEFPLGNGTLYSSLCASPLFKMWIDQGIERISVVPIDNPLADPLIPGLLQGDLAVCGVMKTSPLEKMGSIIEEGGRLKIVEYSELSEEMRLKYLLGYSGVFSANINFFLRAGEIELPWHSVVRGGRVYQEKYIFDAFGVADSPKVVICDRKSHFCPIKEQSDIALAEENLYNLS